MTCSASPPSSLFLVPGPIHPTSPIIDLMTRPRRAPHLESDVRRILESIGPAAAVGPPTLILTVGLPGSGKSTFCRHLAREIDAAVLESDALRRRLFGRPTHLPAESDRLFRAIHAAARRLLAGGASVVIDATNLRETERRPVYALAEEAGARLIVLHFTAPEAVIAERLTRRGAGADSSTAGIDVYQRMTERAEPPRREHWRIDTSDPQATAAVFRRLVDACLSPQGAGVGAAP